MVPRSLKREPDYFNPASAALNVSGQVISTHNSRTKKYEQSKWEQKADLAVLNCTYMMNGSNLVEFSSVSQTSNSKDSVSKVETESSEGVDSTDSEKIFAHDRATKVARLKMKKVKAC